MPNGVRGWADRVAEKLAKAQPGWRYANLAIGSKRLRHVIAEQLEPALTMRPTLVTLYAGGNDILDLKTDVAVLMDDYEKLVVQLTDTGATLVPLYGLRCESFRTPRAFEEAQQLLQRRGQHGQG